MNTILWGYESVWPDVWPKNKSRYLWPIFHGPMVQWQLAGLAILWLLFDPPDHQSFRQEYKLRSPLNALVASGTETLAVKGNLHWKWPRQVYCYGIWYELKPVELHIFLATIIPMTTGQVCTVMWLQYMNPDMTKPTKWVCTQQRLRSAWASTQSDQSLLCALSG